MSIFHKLYISESYTLLKLNNHLSAIIGKMFQKEVTKLSIMEEDRKGESPSKKRSSRSWKSLASKLTDSERMKKTGGGGDKQEGKKTIQNFHLTSLMF